jgi:hypothetical protein
MIQSDLVTREYRRVMIVSVVCTVCFLLRAVMWLLGLVFEDTKDAWGSVRKW